LSERKKYALGVSLWAKLQMQTSSRCLRNAQGKKAGRVEETWHQRRKTRLRRQQGKGERGGYDDEGIREKEGGLLDWGLGIGCGLGEEEEGGEGIGS
jgi:hypothetical protein